MDDDTVESPAFSQPCQRLDSNIEIDDQVASQQVDDHEERQDVPVNIDEELDEEPKLGMEFSSDESAYEFYNGYARKKGFSTRKSWVKKSDDGVITKRHFCCSKEGRKREKKHIDQPKFTRPITRTQCLASIIIKLQVNGKYTVTKFVAEHNHEVVTQSKANILTPQSSLTNAQKAKAHMANDSGITPKVLDYHNIKVLHPHYIMKRWQRDTKVGFDRDHTGLTIPGDCNIPLGKRYKHLCRKLLKIAAMAEEHDEVFKFADKYADKFYDKVMECMKRIKETPQMLSQVVDESVDTKRTCPEPIEIVDLERTPLELTESVDTECARRELTESVDMERACHEPTESVDIDCVHSKPTGSVDTEGAHLEPTKKQVTSVDSLSSQTVCGIKVMPIVKDNRGAHKNTLDKVRKKRSRTESVQPQTDQEKQETTEAPNIMHPPSFQPSHYPFTFPSLNHFNQGSHIAVVSPFGLPSGYHAGHGHHVVMGYTTGPSGSINASLPQCGYQLHNVSMFQQSPFNVGSQVKSLNVTKASRLKIPKSGPSGSMSDPLCQDSSKGSVAFNQSSSAPSDSNQLVGCEDHHLRSSN
ncbi:uncharacterized protein LOC131242148 [Magnolia sinica]|uniref:uncharacterized protein LOC131242148 n=1 Tax=Magnolia sinica TaxID=86752 RepID=UPI00265B5195|nr:uncharacterized protein LOC131242148 [Magnolia sinica]XP_058096576.1 uncharacterized protein LOC131242148 [Magnolia sinica]